MPITALVFLIGTLAMIGVVPLSGFWAKDEILHGGRGRTGTSRSTSSLLVSVFVTGLYMTRLFIRTFLVEPRDQHVMGARARCRAGR